MTRAKVCAASNAIWSVASSSNSSGDISITKAVPVGQRHPLQTALRRLAPPPAKAYRVAQSAYFESSISRASRPSTSSATTPKTSPTAATRRTP
jgi:hypothetical protein